MKKILLVILFILLLFTIVEANPIYLTTGRFYASDIERYLPNGKKVKDQIGEYSVFSATVVIMEIGPKGEWQPTGRAAEEGVLIGVRDTENPEIKELVFAFEKLAGCYGGGSYDLYFSEYGGVENVRAWPIYYQGSMSTPDLVAIDKDNEIILFGENEEYSKALFGDYKTYYAG